MVPSVQLLRLIPSGLLGYEALSCTFRNSGLQAANRRTYSDRSISFHFKFTAGYRFPFPEFYGQSSLFVSHRVRSAQRRELLEPDAARYVDVHSVTVESLQIQRDFPTLR